MPDALISTINTSLEIDDVGKNIYINNEDDYNSFVTLCNTFTFDNSHKKVFHITKDLSFGENNQPDPIKNFYHILDGHGFKISGISKQNQTITYLNDDTSLNLGLIVNNNYGIIRNISLENCNLSLNSVSGVVNENDKYGVGLIVGKNYPSGEIRRCKLLADHISNGSSINACALTGTPNYVYGGICGVNNCGIIDSCVNGATITCTQNMTVGCIVGASGNFNGEATSSGTISNSYNIVNVSFISNPKIFGGIVGFLSHTECVENCIQLLDITSFPTTTSSVFAGEIAGKVENISSGSITSDQITNIFWCYYINSSSTNVGIGNSDIDDIDGVVTKRTWSQIIDMDTYHRSYDFGNIWIMSDMFDEIYHITDSRRPMLLYEVSISGYKDDTDWFDPKIYKHQIKTATQIASLKTIINMDAVKNSSKVHVFDQINDISFNGKLFTHPIGTKEVPFKEIYNGNGYKMSDIRFGGYVPIPSNIQNISIERACTIFGYNYGIIENVWLYNCKVNPNNFSSTTLVDINN